MPILTFNLLLDGLLQQQSGVARAEQLIEAGLSRSEILAHVEGRRWQRYGDHCIVTHNFVPTRPQRMWLAVLEPAGPVSLAGYTALESAGFKFFGQEFESIHILVRRGSTSGHGPGITVHESRRFSDVCIDPRSAIPRTFLPRSAIDAAAWQPFPRYACGLLAAVVQQKVCTANDLEDELPHVGRVRHKPHMRLAIQDIAGGAEALSEIDIARLCRRFGLRPPDRQSIRRDHRGRKRYLDCEWVLFDATIVVLEVDGSHHIEVANWERDMKRERGIVISGRRVLRATANEARHEQRELAEDLLAIGVPRVVRV